MDAIYSVAAILIVCIVFFFVLAELKRNYEMGIDLLQNQLETERELHKVMMGKAAEEREHLLDRIQSDNFAQFKTYSGDAPAKSSKPSNFLKASIEEVAMLAENNHSTF